MAIPRQTNYTEETQINVEVSPQQSATDDLLMGLMDRIHHTHRDFEVLAEKLGPIMWQSDPCSACDTPEDREALPHVLESIRAATDRVQDIQTMINRVIVALPL